MTTFTDPVKMLDEILSKIENIDIVLKDVHEQRNQLFNLMMDLLGKLTEYAVHQSDKQLLDVLHEFHQEVGKIMRLNQKGIN
jgi:hypothetical protein